MSDTLLYGTVLIAAVAHAAWNAILKDAGDRFLSMAAIRFAILVVSLAIMPFVALPGPETFAWMAGAVIFHAAYWYLLIESYRVGDMSLVYPLARGGAPLLLAAISFVFAGERLTTAQLGGTLLVGLGIATLVFGAGGSRQAKMFAGATAVAIGCFTFFDGMGARSAISILSFLVWVDVIGSVGYLALVPFRRSRQEIGAFVRVGALKGCFAGLIAFAGYLAYLNAVMVLPMAPVAAVRESSTMFGALAGVILFREAFGLRRVAAAALVTAGVVVIGLMGGRG
ncbi:MAG: hypothetical protein FJX59_06585 [Alphaproteobacteria bacterium]|nr:hypothetical protein [Alphaproteobacteria bacterium]